MQGLYVTIGMDPPAPPHQAATWIQLTCLAPFAYHQYFVIYDWTFYCTNRGSEPLGSPLASLRNDPTILISSTPRQCLDTAVCTAHDLLTNTTGQASWIAGPVTGVVAVENVCMQPRCMYLTIIITSNMYINGRIVRPNCQACII